MVLDQTQYIDLMGSFYVGSKLKKDLHYNEFLLPHLTNGMFFQNLWQESDEHLHSRCLWHQTQKKITSNVTSISFLSPVAFTNTESINQVFFSFSIKMTGDRIGQSVTALTI